MTQRVMLCFGTRPEAIKMAPVVVELRRRSGIDVVVCVTGQHRQMLDQVLGVFDVKPDIDLAVMKPGQSLHELTANILGSLAPVLTKTRPDLVLVHGDTTTAFASSLAAFYGQIDVGHVEAGLRTFNRYSPWPEEMNRKLVGSLACTHFAPTLRASENLLQEGVSRSSIHVTGNTVVDALLAIRERMQGNVELASSLSERFSFLDPDARLILVTAHRRESFGPGFESICKAMARLADRADVQIVYPVHLNPTVREPVFRLLRGHSNIHLIEPVDYLQFVYLLDRAYLVLTDSGGIQEEAPSFGRPVLVMRDTTERPEAIEAGVARLVGANESVIVASALELLDDQDAYRKMAGHANPFGDGHAARRIGDVIVQGWQQRRQTS